MKSFEPSSAFIQKVSELIIKKLEEENLSIQSIAEEMGISSRTLQLRLKREGKSFTYIVQEARESLAEKYLLNNYPVDEISYILGFSEPSVFRRAFKKWTGVTPKEFRKKHI
ncbi:MAG TPA: AraC family transcriptional regulator [Leptospiraceae bacterium]|nr:AraC family transcriptional regulator [Leptospiraceae bacterium]HNF12229.1 AraC family transcriptional regulator [Leptospiraceae bacterium]HNM01317.1 AraC family transcriptional regulator [Leptospiraceae bacterium]